EGESFTFHFDEDLNLFNYEFRLFGQLEDGLLFQILSEGLYPTFFCILTVKVTQHLQESRRKEEIIDMTRKKMVRTATRNEKEMTLRRALQKLSLAPIGVFSLNVLSC